MRAGCSAVIDPLIMVTERLTGKILLKEQNHGDHSSCPVHSSAGRGSAFLALQRRVGLLSERRAGPDCRSYLSAFTSGTPLTQCISYYGKRAETDREYASAIFSGMIFAYDV
jgi:hypothetical protein